MNGWTGFASLFVGLGIAGYVFHPGTTAVDGAMLERPVARGEPQGADAAGDAARTRLFSPRSPLFAGAPPPPAPQPAAANPVGRSRIVATAEAAPAAAPAAATIATITQQPWITVVQQHGGDGSGNRASRPSGPEARAELARDLQRELKRVGCYEGEVDGSWGGGSKRAMSAFNERVNATLPVEEPDYILLTLLQGHRDRACGEGCGAGQVLADGRCQAQSQTAHAPHRKRSGDLAAAATGSVVVEHDVRAAARGPRPVAAAAAALPPKPVSALTTASTERETRATAPVEPLPGRMTVGGPVPAAAVEQSSSKASVAEQGDHEPAARKAATSAPRAAVAPRPRAPAPVAAPPPHRQRPPQYVYAGSGSGGGSSASRQRSMIYNLFQRPDRLSN